MTEKPFSWPRSSAREVISPVSRSTEPAAAASSTSCWSSSGERRASVKVVWSRKGRKTTFDAAVRNQMIGREMRDITKSGRLTQSATRSDDRSASDFGTSSPMTIDRTETNAITSAKATLSEAVPKPARRSTAATGFSRTTPP